MNQKVFGIGFHTTGTSTLSIALQKLDYKVCGCRPSLVEAINQSNLSPVFNIVDKYDAFQDNPWPILYKELDNQYPDSKFILTIRDENSWIKSALNKFGAKDNNMRKFIYGVGHPQGNELLYKERYCRHNQEVLEYFKDRPNDLLVISWKDGDGWQELCSHLGKPIPNEPFPHVAKSKSKVQKIINSLKKSLKSALI